MEQNEAEQTPFKLLDALPYFDTEWDTDYRIKSKVNEYIEEEMLLLQQSNPQFSSQQYLSHLPKLPSNEEIFEKDPILKKTLQELIERNKQPDLQSEKHYQKLLQNNFEPDCKIVYEYEQIKFVLQEYFALFHNFCCRNVNLQLMERYNATKWKSSNDKLDFEKDFLKRKVNKIKDECTELNLKRKREQIDAGRQIQILQQRYNDTLQRQFALRREIQNEQSKRIKLL